MHPPVLQTSAWERFVLLSCSRLDITRMAKLGAGVHSDAHSSILLRWGRAEPMLCTVGLVQTLKRSHCTWREVQYLVLPGPITACWGTSFKLEGKEAGTNYVLFDLGNGNPLSFTTSSPQCCWPWCQDSCQDWCRGREDTAMAFQVQKYKMRVLKYSSRLFSS